MLAHYNVPTLHFSPTLTNEVRFPDLKTVAPCTIGLFDVQVRSLTRNDGQ
jgi:hypothetical protein